MQWSKVNVRVGGAYTQRSSGLPTHYGVFKAQLVIRGNVYIRRTA